MQGNERWLRRQLGPRTRWSSLTALDLGFNGITYEAECYREMRSGGGSGAWPSRGNVLGASLWEELKHGGHGQGPVWERELALLDGCAGLFLGGL
jgi:hypothetical protein